MDKVPLSVQGHNMVVNFQVMNMSQADVILGREWLHGLGYTLKHTYKHNSLMFQANGAHVLLFGKRDVPFSLLICST